MKEKTTIKQKHMKKILMMFALLLGVSAAWAQQSSGDYYEGLTRKIGFSQMIPPHGLESKHSINSPFHSKNVILLL